MDWRRKGKVCSSCPRMADDVVNEDCRARLREDERELEMQREEKNAIELRYIDRVNDMVKKRGWNRLVLIEIPRYQAVVWRKNITPTDNALRLLERHIEKSMYMFAYNI
jgi:hypothetical protein